MNAPWWGPPIGPSGLSADMVYFAEEVHIRLGHSRPRLSTGSPMKEPAIQAITFDLWDTLIVDDSDEPVRARRGLKPKPEERRALVHRFLERHGEVADREAVDVAYDTTDAAFREVWYGQNVTWTVRTRLGVLLSGLKRGLPEEELQELVRLHEEMELEVRPALADGAKEMLEALEGKYRLGVISDAIFSPGRTLRELLSGYGILRFFEVLVFSDEIGCCKPDPRIFEAAARGLEVDFRRMAHIGDREQKDIDGPRAVGAKGILCTAVKDRGSAGTAADAVCKELRSLPGILEQMNSK